MRADRKQFLFASLVVLWGTGVLASVYFLGRYEFTPGETEFQLKNWPDKLGIDFVAGKKNILVAAHPHCPCSKASLGELKQALDAFGKEAAVHIVFYLPAKATATWSQTELVEKSKLLPQAKVTFDASGKIATAIGARTSFDVFLFDADKKIVFRGGITGGRGVIGENAGRAAFEKALAGKSAGEIHPVYGCPLQKNSKNKLEKV